MYCLHRYTVYLQHLVDARFVYASRSILSKSSVLLWPFSFLLLVLSVQFFRESIISRPHAAHMQLPECNLSRCAQYRQ